MTQCILVGGGPAGLSAALTLSAHKIDFLWFGTEPVSAKVARAEKISNYPGLPGISGAELAAALLRQEAEAGLHPEPKTVTGVYDMGDFFGILAENQIYEAKSVILATGVAAQRPIPGELEHLGAGVSYCATCDGALYKGKTIAVICTAPALAHEIPFLASLAAKVYLVAPRLEPALPENVERISGWPLEIAGTGRAQSLVFKDRTLAVDGVFLLKDALPPTALVGGLETQGGHIAVDRAQRTSLPGCFAAGDCTGRPYQLAKAVGEGNVAAHSVLEYLRHG